MYDVYLERSAERDLKRISKGEFSKIIAHIKSLTQNPRPIGCHKIIGSKGDWRIRVGDYRVIYEIDEKTKVVKVFKVKHRKEAYR